MDFKDYYKILGVETTADKKAIKTAYRKLARKFHPDVSDHHEAEDKFKEVTEAYEVLKNPEKRAEFDDIRQYGRHGEQFEAPPGWRPSQGFSDRDAAQHQGNMSDFFSSIFGAEGHGSHEGYENQQGFNRRGQDIETDLPILLEETLGDSTKTIAYKLPHYDLKGLSNEINKTLNVKIPGGVREGERIRLKGQGAPGIGSGVSGDLYLRIRLIPHPLFDVEGHNLILTVPLSPWEAALGLKITMPTLSGKIQLSIPANSQTGQRLRIKGKGLNRKDGQGDLYAVLKVVMPTSTNDTIKEHWEQLKTAAAFDPREEWSKP